MNINEVDVKSKYFIVSKGTKFTGLGKELSLVLIWFSVGLMYIFFMVESGPKFYLGLKVGHHLPFFFFFFAEFFICITLPTNVCEQSLNG